MDIKRICSAGCEQEGPGPASRVRFKILNSTMMLRMGLDSEPGPSSSTEVLCQPPAAPRRAQPGRGCSSGAGRSQQRPVAGAAAAQPGSSRAVDALPCAPPAQQLQLLVLEQAGLCHCLPGIVGPGTRLRGWCSADSPRDSSMSLCSTGERSSPRGNGGRKPQVRFRLQLSRASGELRWHLGGSLLPQGPARVAEITPRCVRC